jgi:peptidoglycan-N-acetylmuramic acid deacetylase
LKKIILLTTLLLCFLGVKASAKGFGLSPHKEGERPKGSYSEIDENGGKWIGSDDKRVYLTFDCGYENGYTKDILQTLKNNNVKATFFITGHYLNSSKDIVKIMIDDGHIIGNHTLNHKDFSISTNEEILNDVRKLEDNFYKQFNIKMSKYVRPPKGEYSKESMKVLNENGYKNVFWSLAYVDWYKDKYYGNNYSYKKVMSKIHNGAIILMHTVGKDNKEDLGLIIKELKSMGYKFSSLDELYNDLSI